MAEGFSIPPFAGQYAKNPVEAEEKPQKSLKNNKNRDTGAPNAF